MPFTSFMKWLYFIGIPSSGLDYAGFFTPSLDEISGTVSRFVAGVFSDCV